MDVDLELLRDWIEVPSVTGAEGDYAEAVARALRGVGYAVERQELSPGRFNLLARCGVPRVVYCTHLDTVPPWFGSRLEGGVMHGRGACDAKGPLLAMLAAARALLESGEDRVGFLLTVGEEIDSAGAALADRKLAEPWQPEFTIVGEPTQNTFVQSHKGVFKARLRARGVAGHSSQAVGPSAVHELSRTICALLDLDWGHSETFGDGSVNIGTIAGGVAPNVVADRAEASLLARIVEPADVVAARIDKALGAHVELERHEACYGPIAFHVPRGRDSIRVAFGTDAPHLSNWGQKLLYGPGRILDAHTDHERVQVASLRQAADDYRSTAHGLLERIGARTEPAR